MCIYELKDESDNAKTTLPAMEFSIFFEAFTTTFTWIVSAGPLLLITGASNVAWLTMALDMVLGREKKEENSLESMFHVCRRSIENSALNVQKGHGAKKREKINRQ